nr:hypothetical protein [Tanacetum cinerariifolium]
MNLLQEVMDTCAALTRRLEHLEFDKVAQALEITKLKRKRVDTSDDTVMDDESNQGRMIAEMDQDDAIVLEDDKEEDREVVDAVKDVEKAKVDESAQDQGRQAESHAEIYKMDMDHTNKVLSMQEDAIDPAKVQEVVDVVTTTKLITEVVTATSETVIAAIAAAPSRRRKGVVIRDPEEESTTSIIIPAETKSKDKGKEILDIDWDEAIDHVKRKAKEDPAVKRYQVLKRKPQTKAQARNNMMMYLKNVASFKMDYFNGMSYDDIRPIFEAKFNSNVAFLLKTKKQIEEDENKALQKINETPAERAAKRRKLDEELEELKRNLKIVPNADDDVYTEATPLAQKVPVVDYQIIEMNNKPYYKIIRADDTHQLYISFLTLLRNFNRDDLEALWSLVKEIFSTTRRKNFYDDFLLVTLRAMFEKPDLHAQIWKNQRTVHGPAKVKGWKLLESCSVHIITFTSTQLNLLLERKYLLKRFTLDQMLNAVRLEVEEESEVSLELLRLTRQQHQEGQLE